MENRLFKEKFDFPYDLLSDEARKISMLYGAAESAGQEYPDRISYLIDPDSRIKRVFAKVEPASHPDEVLKMLG